MRYQKLFKLANLFYSLASKEAEELPSNYKNLKTILSNVDKLETYKAKVEYCEKNLLQLNLQILIL